MGYKKLPWLAQILLVITEAVRNRWEWILADGERRTDGN